MSKRYINDKGKKTGMTKEESFNKILEYLPENDERPKIFSDNAMNEICEEFYCYIPTVEFKTRTIYILLLNSVYTDGYWTNYKECYDKIHKGK